MKVKQVGAHKQAQKFSAPPLLKVFYLKGVKEDKAL